MHTQEALDLFVIDRKAQNLSPKTISNYEKGILAVLDPSEELETITATELKKRILSLPVQPTSKQTYLKYLKAFFSYLKEDGVIQSDPTEKVKPPKAKQKVLDALMESEVEKILSSNLSDRERALFMVMLDTGMRIEEVSRLKRSQFDRNGCTVITGKGNKERLVKVSPTTRKALMIYERSVEGNSLWVGREGTLTVRSLRNILENIGDRVGVKLNPHKIRRTTTITMLRRGCDLWSLAQVLGHSDITILKRYLPLVQADARTAFEKFQVL